MKNILEVEVLENAGCNNGNYPSYRVLNLDGEVVEGGITCNCGKGCSDTDDISKYENNI